MELVFSAIVFTGALLARRVIRYGRNAGIPGFAGSVQ